MSLLPAIFVSAAKALKHEGGGVQACTREYREVVTAAGFDLKMTSFDFRLSIGRRVQNRLFPRITQSELPPALHQKIFRAVTEYRPSFVFYNFNVFAGLLRSVRTAFPSVRQILLSHGVESVDFCIDQRLRRRDGAENHARFRVERMLGQQLLNESEQRAELDAVITLSPFEVEIEKWLGARNVISLPGTVTEFPLAHEPVDGRVGCVSTLDHPPNWDGLIRLFRELSLSAPAKFEFRLVGAPASQGRELARQFSFVKYLGALDDEALRTEAATWCCFVHPLFVYAKGRSTKLAVALGWGLPIATTITGARGYIWLQDRLPLAAEPAQLANAAVERSALKHFEHFREQTRDVVSQAPRLDRVATEVREFLATVRS